MTNTERNPQAQQMGDESMARTLAAQAQAIWPQERALFARYGLSGALRVLDLGCGTGEITRRLADMYPQGQVIGVDILDGNAATVGNGTMVALIMNSKEKVDALHKKAMELGGKDEGAPGPRGEGFYSGYFRDLDGNKLNAFFMG